MLLARIANPGAMEAGNSVVIVVAGPTDNADILRSELGKKLHGWAEYHGNANIRDSGAQK